MSALANTIRQLSGQLALLRAERERYQALCAAAYQLAGAMNAPVRFLDALADGANGEIEARQKTDDLLPVDPKEMGAFPAWSDENVVAMEAEIALLREDLQAAKLLAHANGEMFRAQKAEHALLREAMREPTLTVCRFPGGASWAADGVNERVAEAAFMQCADTVTIHYGERRVFTNMAAFHNHVHARDCSKCGQKDVPANVYCKCVDCPLNPSRQSST